MRKTWAYLAAGILLTAAAFRLTRPSSAPRVESAFSLKALPGSLPTIRWPQQAEAAVDIAGVGWFGRHGATTPVPIGSVTKVMTAWVLLHRYPLGPTANGPSITVTSADVALYRHDVASRQSVAPVIAGERLNERQLLEGLLIGSGNNIAVMVAHWLSGHQSTFADEMNREAQRLGLHHTHYVGPSGLNPENLSTPQDQIRLAKRAMALAVFRQIVGMAQTSWPGTPHPLYNYNWALGRDGIIGVKTGSTVNAGGCFVFAAPRTVGDRNVTIYGAVLGQPGTRTVSQLQLSLNDGESLITQVSRVLRTYRLVSAGQPLGRLQVPWSHPIPIVAASSLSVIGWPGMPLTSSLSLRPGHSQGVLSVSLGGHVVTVPVRLTSHVPPPPLWWRLIR